MNRYLEEKEGFGHWFDYCWCLALFLLSLDSQPFQNLPECKEPVRMGTEFTHCSFKTLFIPLLSKNGKLQNWVHLLEFRSMIILIWLDWDKFLSRMPTRWRIQVLGALPLSALYKVCNHESDTQALSSETWKKSFNLP